MNLLIAVDGPAASGKGTIAIRLASLYHLPYLDTGLIYRAVGVAAERERISPVDAALALDRLNLQDPALRRRGAGEAASKVSAIPRVRAALQAFQRAFAAQAGGAVLDGRDIGTVIAPAAQVKLFVTADPDIRAGRRWRQLSGQGEDVSLADVLADIVRRDERDSTRAAAPLVQADDAILLDTSNLDVKGACAAAFQIVETVLGRAALR